VLVHVADGRRAKEALGRWPSDDTLAAVSEVMVREAPPTTLLGRVGVLDLAALVPDADRPRIEQWIRTVRRHLADIPSHPALRWGFAVLGHDGTTMDALFLRAEADLYRPSRRAASTSSRVFR
jgi:GGDEF domain-containing protein